jgi:hypothetical protein
MANKLEGLDDLFELKKNAIIKGCTHRSPLQRCIAYSALRHVRYHTGVIISRQDLNESGQRIGPECLDSERQYRRKTTGTG